MGTDGHPTLLGSSWQEEDSSWRRRGGLFEGAPCSGTGGEALKLPGRAEHAGPASRGRGWKGVGGKRRAPAPRGAPRDKMLRGGAPAGGEQGWQKRVSSVGDSESKSKQSLSTSNH